MKRYIAGNREPSSKRPLAFGRKVLGFSEDGKFHVVLDTNIPLNAMWALKKGSKASVHEAACLTIVKAVANKRIVIGINHLLWAEYMEQASKYVSMFDLPTQKVFNMLDESNRTPFRVLVDPQEYSPDPADDFLFNGLSADYLISENLKHVRSDRLKGRKSPYAKTLRAIEFIPILETEVGRV